MASIREFYGSKFLNAKDLEKKVKEGKIKTIVPQPLTGRNQQSRFKLVMDVEGIEKPVIVNATNATILAAVWGEDYTEWVDKRIRLSVHTVTFNGQPMDGIKMDPIGKK